MIYGLDNYILTNPLSILNSIILILGVYRIGLVSQKLILKNFFSIKKNNDIHYYSFLFGVYIVSYFLYIVTISQLINFLTFRIIAIIIYFLGLFTIASFLLDKKITNKFNNIKKLSYHFYLKIFCLFGIMLISLSPITHSDSLGYHVASSINILNKGSFDTELLPVTFKLASIGELMIALGFSIKLEQFGALVQFSSLLTLIPLFTKKKNLINHLILLTIFITPVTIFYISSPKPQLVQCVSTLLIFSFLIKKWINYSQFQIKIILSIIFFILAINVLTKYSFIVSSFILYLYCLYIMYKKNFFRDALYISLIIFFITIMPSWIYRHIYFDTSYLGLLFSPLPINIYGYQQLHSLLSPNTFDILTLIIPRNLGQLSTTYGPILFLIFFIKISSIKKYKDFYLIVVLFSFIHFYFGSNLSRFFYEGFLWLMYLLTISKLRDNKYLNLFISFLKVQILLGICLIYFFAYSLFPGSLSNALRDKVMTENANGYSLAKWVNENVDDDNIILTSHRSISLYNNETYPMIFTWLVDFKNKDSFIYANYLKKKKIDKIIFYGDKLDYGPFENCLGKEQKYKKDVGERVGRNPLNKRNKYDGWIYDFDYNLLPGCLLR
tara:strand:- start:382 stop:2211 length:1830 start_codon:yes stop_codon:yes gene_type:complete